MILKPGLYIVSTPIGNLEDITIRALEMLKNSAIILCEDTKRSSKLLAKYNIKVKLQIYNDHSSSEEREKIKVYINNGGVVSLISDAGTPLISDPGYKLVKHLQKFNYYIDVIPGVSSVITALTISGLPTDRFLFAGFLPRTIASKKKIFSELLTVNSTLIFFETTTRLLQTLKVVLDVLGNREICIARELTKMHQEIKSGMVKEIVNFYQNNSIKGEIVLLISGSALEINKDNLLNDLTKMINLYLSKGWTAKSVTDMVHKNFKMLYSKKEIYSIVNGFKKTIKLI